MAKKYRTELQVRSYELDFYGHVNNATYLNYLEYARGKFLEQEGLSFKELAEADVYLLVVRAELDYRSPAQLSDWLEIEGWIEKIGNTSAVFRQIIRNKATGREVLDSRVTVVFANGARKPIPVPDFIREKFL